MGFKQHVEESAVYYLFGALVTGFLAGATAYQTVSEKWAHRTTISTQDLAELKARADAPAPQAKTVPTYTEGVVTFLNSEPKKNYELDGYTADITELNVLAQQFLLYMQQHPTTTYSDAQSFYGDMDDAASMVTRRALRTFNSPGDQIRQKLDYNWKVYCSPSLFRIHIDELRNEHMGGLSGQQITTFQDKFNRWRTQESGISP
jgi:hypothetical protein